MVDCPFGMVDGNNGSTTATPDFSLRRRLATARQQQGTQYHGVMSYFHFAFLL
jgi:hypothetical protein